MSNLTQFSFQDNQVRVISIEGKPWFVAVDVCKILDLENTSRAVSRLKNYEKGVTTINTLGGNQELSIIAESGLYRLALTSRKPQAEPFQDWVCEEVIPSISKTGKYELNPQPKLNIYAQRVDIASKWKIPKGYWCVFHEISLLANKVGEEYPVGKYDLIDGSVGLCWAKYRKDFEWAGDTVKFPIFFNDNRDKAHIEAIAYLNSELVYFRNWLEDIYTYDKLPKYLGMKYKELIPATSDIL